MKCQERRLGGTGSGVVLFLLRTMSHYCLRFCFHWHVALKPIMRL